MALKEMDPAPDFEILDDQGNAFRLSDLRGQRVVLYFYPKADTPGCTTESCSFRDELPQFKKRGVAVLGISPDEPSAQAKFKAKYQLTFPLLADANHAVAESFGVWKEKKNYGKTYMGVERTTFIIGVDGRITRIFPKVKVDGHTEAVLAALG